MSEYTEGPWHVADNDTDSGCKIINAEGRTVALSNPPGPPVEECQANARLIAAAPDLLAALEALVNRHQNPRTPEGGVHAGDRCAVRRRPRCRHQSQGHTMTLCAGRALTLLLPLFQRPWPARYLQVCRCAPFD